MAEKSVPTIVDVLIIGAGPAGLAAALTLARQRHTVIVFDSGRYRCDPAREFNIVPTWEHKAPQDYLRAARAEVSRYETVQLEAVEVVALAKNEDTGVFEASDAKENKYKGRKVILASGVQEIFPDIAGYKECWGKGMYVEMSPGKPQRDYPGLHAGTVHHSFHCLFCHGYEQSLEANGSAGVLAVQMLAMPSFALHMAHMAAQLASHRVTVYTNGNEPLAQEIIAKSGPHPAWTTDTRKIIGVEMHTADAQSSAIDISFEDGSKVTEGFLAHSPLTAAKGPWAEQVGLALTQMGDYEAKPPFFETSVKGIFVAGDCMTPFKVAANAIANGSTVGAGVATRLQEEKYGLEPIY